MVQCIDRRGLPGLLFMGGLVATGCRGIEAGVYFLAPKACSSFSRSKIVGCEFFRFSFHISILKNIIVLRCNSYVRRISTI